MDLTSRLLAHSRALWPRFLFGLGCSGLLLAAGCGEPAEVVQADVVQSDSAQAVQVADATQTEQANDAAASPLDTWEVIYVQGARAGYAHTSRQPTTHDGQPAVEIRVVNDLTLRRFGEVTTQRIVLTSLETPTGQLLQLRSETNAGPQAIVLSARVEGNQLHIESGEGPQRTTRSIPWQPGTGGLMAVEDSLTRRPMQPGETRTVKLPMPVFNELLVVENTLQAVDYESTELLDESAELLRIDSKVTMPGGLAMETTMWTDRQGHTLKSDMGALGMESFRTTRQVALDESGDPALDLGLETLVRVSEPILHPHRTAEIRYRVRLRGSDPSEMFATGPTQSVRPIDARTAEITVRAEPRESDDDAAVQQFEDADKLPNDWIQSDDPLVQQLARRGAGSHTDPAQLALALERFVHDEIAEKNFSQVFATAADVARSLEGDCTEHSVLLAALARAQGIPARVAVGLVYVASEQAFGYHMWNELFVDGRWVPLDSTLGQGGIGAAHLKFTDSNLSEGGGITTLLPVVQALGQLEIEVLEVTPIGSRHLRPAR